MAVEAMKEIGIDISHHTPKSVEEVAQKIGAGLPETDPDAEDAGTLGGMPLDIVVTVCDDAKEKCPYVPAREGNIHVGSRTPPPARAPTRKSERRSGGFAMSWPTGSTQRSTRMLRQESRRRWSFDSRDTNPPKCVCGPRCDGPNRMDR